MRAWASAAGQVHHDLVGLFAVSDLNPRGGVGHIARNL
jgi:hypothetical protein